METTKVKQKNETTKQTVAIRLYLPKRTHRKLKAYNLSQPKETLSKSAIALINKSLQTPVI